MRTELSAESGPSRQTVGPVVRTGANKKLAVFAVVAVALGAVVIWLNFGRGQSAPPAEALEAARAAAAEISAAEPAPDPAAPPAPAPTPSPARPTPLGGK